MTAGSTHHGELPATSPDPDLDPGQQVGEYVVEDKLGQGGFGAVFKATHPLIGKVVAIKVLARKFSVDPEMVERFVAEARAVNQIRHRNIIDIFSFGQLADGRHYYVMEYLAGDPLDAILERDKRMSLADALPILRAIARALDACHAKGIAHRDLKPANIFLAQDPDGDRYPKLLDFGIAKLMGPEDTLKQKTRTGIPMGTPYYMSPEQSRGRHVDHRTDYYAFGVVAYEMLTGTVPFDGDDYMSILMQQISDPAPPPSSRVADLPDGIDDALAWLMQKDPAARPPSLVAAVQALEASAEASGIAIPIARESGVVSAQGGRSPSSLRRSAPPVPSQAGIAVTMPSGTAPIEDETRRSRVPLMLGVAGVLAAIVAVMFAMRGNETGEPAATPAAPIKPAVAEPPKVLAPQPDPVAAAAVTITISGVPDGTEVLARGKPIGTAPGPIQLDQGTGTVVLMFKADGYQADSRSITPDRDQPLALQLKKKAPPTTPTTRTKPTTTTTTKTPGKDDIAVPTFK